MDESSEPIASGNGGGENNGFGTREAHLVGVSPQENRRSATNALGEVEESESKIDGSPTLGSLLLSGTESKCRKWLLGWDVLSEHLNFLSVDSGRSRDGEAVRLREFSTHSMVSL